VTCPGHTEGSYPASLKSIPASQGGALRHACAVCAYLRGVADAAETEARLRERVRALSEELATLKTKAK
jgi:hypothetical protein